LVSCKTKYDTRRIAAKVLCCNERLSGEWRDDDYDVLADGVVIGRIMKASVTPEATPWMWMLAFGQDHSLVNDLGRAGPSV
jgi:hypothetical protein